MGGIEGKGGDVAEGTGEARQLIGGQVFIFSVLHGAEGVSAAQGVAVVLDEPEIVLIDQIHDGGEVERDAHCVGHHDRLCFRSDGGSQTVGDGCIVGEVHIYKDGNQLILEDGVERRGEAAGRGNDLITGLEAAILELGEVRVVNATRLADEPEFTSRALARPR